MTDFSTKAPVHPERVHDLHDQEQMPKGPAATLRDLAGRFSIVWVGLLLAIGFTAMGVDIRDGWDARRDPLVPGAATVGAIGGICLAYLIVRNHWQTAAIGLVLVAAALSAMFFDYLTGAYVDNGGGWQTTFTIIAGITYVAGMLYFLGAWLWIERTKPTEAPAPEGM